TPGAHIDLQVGGYSRRYSLCGRRGDSGRFEIAVLREAEGRGGSRFIHDELAPGTLVSVGGPKNHFRLDETKDRYLLVAGGIGITPILAMADRLQELGRDYVLHYCGRARRTMAFLDRLEADHGDRLRLYPAEEGRRLDVAAVVEDAGASGTIYACGPARLLDALEALTRDRPDRLRVEHFSSDGAVLDPEKEIGFDVELTDSELTIHVPPTQT